MLLLISVLAAAGHYNSLLLHYLAVANDIYSAIHYLWETFQEQQAYLRAAQHKGEVGVMRKT